MPPYGKRKTVERGIYRDRRGFEVLAKVGQQTIWKRFDADTSLREMRAWRDQTVSDLRSDAKPTSDPTTVAGSIDKYQRIVKTVDAPTLASFKAWRDRHGDLPRRKLTPALCQQAFDAWRAAGLSNQTLFYRRLVLQKLWRALDGPSVKTPVDDIKIRRDKPKRPVWVSDDVIASVAATLEEHEQPRPRTNGEIGEPVLRDAKTRARFLVLATTGQRPSQMKRAQPTDLVLADTEPEDGEHFGMWWVKAAKGGDPTPVYLTREMWQAWKLFVEADAWGEFDRRAFARTLRRCGWPERVRVYNLRHAVALTLSEAGVDLRDISSHLGHKDLKTTQVYAPQLHSRLRRLSGKLANRFNGKTSKADS